MVSEPLLRLEWRSAEELLANPQNWRTHPPQQMQPLEALIFGKDGKPGVGWAGALLFNERTGRLIDGHARKELALKRGGDVPVLIGSWTEEEERLILVSLDPIAGLAGRDEDILNRLLSETVVEDESLQALLDSLSTARRAPGDVDQDDAPDPGTDEEAFSKPGDIWLLGCHRLMCGDSTNPEDLARLMNGQTAQLLATDPPYLVDYDGTNHPAEHHANAGREAAEGKELGNKHWDAYVDPSTSVDFFAGFMQIAMAHCIERVPVYQWHASRRQSLVEDAWKRNGLLVHQTIIWVKSRAILTRSHFLWQHEPCFYGWPEGKMPIKGRRPDTNATTVWQIDQAGDPKGLHPTIKPVRVFADPIAWHTKPGDICLEPFSGSGTQIVAAEQLGRSCYAMEKSPAFVDVGVRRWEKFTGQKAQTEDGRVLPPEKTE